MEKNKLNGDSSLLVSLPAVFVWLALGLLCAAIGYHLLMGIFLFLFLLSSSARLWSRRAMHGVSLEIRCETCRLFPGMETEVRYTVKNEKLLPLIWLELSQNAAEQDSIVPDDSFERYTYRPSSEEEAIAIEGFRRTFSFVMGFETLTLTGKWTAMRRGIYKPDKLLLRSGDGFGLTQVERIYPGEKVPEFVIYPRRVPVDVSLFLRSDWERSAGSAGYAEDMTILRGLRPYQANDPWKRINWRMAARQPGELKVNFYETVQPVTALFLLDGESFCGLDQEDTLLEDALETLASVISQLFSRGVACGLLLPESRRFPPVSLPPSENRSAAELLYYLAGYQYKGERVIDKDGNVTDVFVPSRFDLATVAAASSVSGIVSIVTYDPDGLSTRLMDRLGNRGITIFSQGKTACTDPERKVLPLSCLREGGAY